MNDRALLSPTIIKLLCLGPRALPPIQTLSPADAALVGHLFREGASGYAKLWLEHEVVLRAEAARLNLRRPAHGGSEYFGEEICRREREHRAKAARR